jgi:hypothetical protein
MIHQIKGFVVVAKLAAHVVSFGVLRPDLLHLGLRATALWRGVSSSRAFAQTVTECSRGKSITAAAAAGRALPSGRSYYVLRAKNARNAATANAFVSWLVAETKSASPERSIVGPPGPAP